MEHIASDLIIGFLKGILTDDETNRFYDWINAAPENKEIFFEAKMIYDVCLSQGKGNSRDIDKSWYRLLEKRRQKNRLYPLFQRIRPYAAAVIITIALTSVTFFTIGSFSVMPVAQYVSGDGIVADRILLSDGTQVCMGSRTKFRYDSQYGRDKRVVYLEGEAFFDVAKQKGKPFIVVVNGQTIEALGTKFNVEAYPADSIATTTLLEGSVCLVSDSVYAPTILKPNQQYIYNRNRGSYDVEQVEASLYTSWISGYYYFRDESLEGILGRLGHIYGIDFRIQSDKLKERKFTGTFYRGQSIKDILDVINISIPIQYRIDEQEVVIY